MSTTDSQDICPKCGMTNAIATLLCDRCGEFLGYPNVREARGQKDALHRRYAETLRSTSVHATETIIKRFETIIAQSSHAVIGRALQETVRLISDENERYISHYAADKAGLRILKKTKFNKWRSEADDLLFPGYKEEIRFASLSLDGTGSQHYGPCFWVLLSESIEKRASVFEENSTLWVKRLGIDPFANEIALPEGYRAEWSERGKLSVTKLAHKINNATMEEVFASLLFRSGVTGEKDDFIEVNIYGQLSVHNIERIVLTTKPEGKTGEAFLTILQERVDATGNDKRAPVILEERWRTV